ncbi:MAG: MAPEG family protein [Pseudomonadota bacterium]
MYAPITTSVAIILGLWLVALSFRVIDTRRTSGVSLGDGEDKNLSRRIRAQANLAEYAPVSLILLFLAEAQGASSWMLVACSALLVIGRLAHGFALGFTEGNVPGRTGGMIMTFTAIVLLAATNIWTLLTYS